MLPPISDIWLLLASSANMAKQRSFVRRQNMCDDFNRSPRLAVVVNMTNTHETTLSLLHGHGVVPAIDAANERPYSPAAGDVQPCVTLASSQLR
jgi:hypothetical protein